MSQHQNSLKLLLQTEAQLPAFSAQSLFLPENQDGPNKLKTPGEFEVPSFRWLPFRIEFPIPRDHDSGKCADGGQFMNYARRALELEKHIFHSILDASDQMRTALAEAFQVELIQAEPVQNLLRRIQALHESKQQLVPGVYLGATKCDSTIGDVLQEALEKAWRRANRVIPEELKLLCREWGEVQSRARTAIISASWSSLVNRGTWPTPTAFEDNMGSFLEGRLPEVASETFWSWYSQIEALSESASSASLRIITAVRTSGAGFGKGLPIELVEELQDPSSSFPTWEQYLRNPKTVNPRILAEEIFPDEQTRPIEISFLHGIPHAIAITEQQALNYGCFYLSNFDPQEVSIVYSDSPGESQWRNLRRGPEVRALAASPLAHFIREIEVDCFTITQGECLGIFDEQMKFLKAFEEIETWRAADSSHSLTLTFKNLDHTTRYALTLKCMESGDLFSEWSMQTPTVEQGYQDRINLRIPWILRSEDIPE